MSEHMNIYTFHESFEERLEEYIEILTTEGKVIPASQIHEEWSCDVELVIEPVGWQAFWNIPRSTCENYHIRYPTVVLVEVLGTDYPTLCASVKITAVQDDIQLPEKHEVPLIELYPTIKQKNTSLDILGTAHCVDRLRLFYNHLWMPWDEDDDDDIDWVDQHLRSRLRLYYDMQGVINKETCDIIKSLLSEGREIRNKITILECALPDDDDAPQEELAKETCALMQLHLRLQQIKAEIDVLENPQMRDLLWKNRSLEKKKKRSNNTDKDKSYYLVWEGGTVKQLQEVSNKIHTMLPEDMSIKICGYLEDVLDISEVGDTILLGEGKHPIKHSSGLGEKGTIIGIHDTEKVILSPRESDVSSSLLNFHGTEILLKNICIDLEELQAGIIIRKDCTAVMTNCRICVSSTNPSSVKWGVIAMPGAKLVFNKTVFQGLGTAVVTYATSEVILNECRFEKCYEGVRLTDNVRFTATECSFNKIESCAVVMESETVNRSGTKIGSEEIFGEISEISFNECKFDKEKSFMLKPKSASALMTLNKTES
ncbi:protein nessun dorma-like [Ooceraea biroi]|uniref:protein nessun dorma-like n=1 Tax=Ooceraea biroi TaxID=2015173 RepID=UPI000F08CBFA|nr:protein nessun dorma-like [Ooceraea biroi]